MKINCIYIFTTYLLSKQILGFRLLCSCVFCLSSFLQVYQQAGILENSVIIYLILLLLYFSASFLVACSSLPTFETKSRRNLGHIFPRTIRRPLDQELDQAA